MKTLIRELEQILEKKFCLGCSKSCDLLHPTCHNGLERMEEVIENYQKEHHNGNYINKNK